MWRGTLLAWLVFTAIFHLLIQFYFLFSTFFKGSHSFFCGVQTGNSLTPIMQFAFAAGSTLYKNLARHIYWSGHIFCQPSGDFIHKVFNPALPPDWKKQYLVCCTLLQSFIQNCIQIHPVVWEKVILTDWQKRLREIFNIISEQSIDFYKHPVPPFLAN